MNDIEALQAFNDSLVQLADEEAINQLWYRFTDDTVLPDGAEGTARLAFQAGYATALGHIGTVLQAAIDALEGEASSGLTGDS